MKTITCVMAGIVVFFLTVKGPSAAVELTLVYTNSLNGRIDTCDCPANPRGGLIKRGTALKELRRNNPNMLLFESGDFITYEPDSLGSKYVVLAMKRLGYDAFSLGDQEFTLGVLHARKIADELPVVCNNVMIKNGNSWSSPFPRHRIVERPGVKIGIIGVMGKGVFEYYPDSIKKSVRIGDEVSEIRKDVASLKRKGATMIVLLSHMGMDRDKELQPKLDGVHVIVGGHTQNLIANPEIRSNSIIVQAGADGAHIGVLKLRFEQGKITGFSNSFILPTNESTRDDPEIRKLIADYRKEVKEQQSTIRFR